MMQNYNFLSANLIKKYSKLKQKKYRDEFQLFLAEGIKICEELIHSDYDCEALLVEQKYLGNNPHCKVIKNFAEKGIRILITKSEFFNKIADSKSPQGLIAIAEQKEMNIAADAKAFVAIENSQDPGNLGTILRTALWFGIRDIILSSNSVDIYNPKTVRSTMGNLFQLNIVYTEDLYNYCRKVYPEHRYYGASLEANSSIHDIAINERFGLFFGNEANGLTQDLVDKLDELYIIPGAGLAESLNLSVSAGISLYHFTNQSRNK